jgi:hypothetical protein
MRPRTVLIAGVAALLTACGGGGGGSNAVGSPDETSPQPSPSVSTPVPTVHTAEPGEPALIPVPGYTYKNDRFLDTKARRDFVQMDAYKSYSIHIVTNGRKHIGVLMLLKAKPAANEAVASGQVDPLKLVPTPGVVKKIAGQRVLTNVPEEFSLHQKEGWWIWWHDGTLSQFWLATEAINIDALPFLTKYWREANG